MKIRVTKSTPSGEFTEQIECTSSQALGQHLIEGGMIQPSCKTDKAGKPRFESADFLALAIDTKRLSVEGIRSAAYTQEFGALLVCPESPESGSLAVLVFGLAERVEDAKTYALMLAGIETIYPAAMHHRTVIDPVWAPKLAAVEVIGRQLSVSAMAELKMLGVETKSIKASKGEAMRSRLIVTPDVTLKVDDWTEMTLDRLSEGVEVFCPVHIDTKQAATTVRTRDGKLALVCRECQRSYTQKSVAVEYGFGLFSSVINSLEDDKVWMESHGHPITKSAERYLPVLTVVSGILCVQSPKGSGKTEQLVQIVAEARLRNQSVLLIGHRRSLLSVMAIRLGIDCYFINEQDVFDKITATYRDPGMGLVDFGYVPPTAALIKKLAGLDVDQASEIINVKPTDHYAVSLDSLTKLNTGKITYGVVIVDECEQVFGHLVGDTLKKDNKRREVYLKLCHLLRVAESVILMDADLGMVTMRALFGMGLKGETHIRFHLNEYSQHAGTMRVYPNSGQLLQRIHQAVAAGEKCFVATNSKSKAVDLEKALNAQHSGKAIMCVHKENSSSAEVQAMLKDIAGAFEHRIDVLIASPSLGTGIDITFKGEDGGNRVVVQHVFGLFVGRTTTHFECDQHLMRVRHPGSVHVWADGVGQSFETDPNLLRAQLSRMVKDTQLLIGYDDAGKARYADDDGLLGIWAEHLAVRNGSLNRLADHLLDLRQANGWGIEHVDLDAKDSASGDSMLKAGRAERLQEREDRIIAATVFTDSDDDREALRALVRKDSKGVQLTQDETDRLERLRIERFYGLGINSGLVKFDGEGRMRSCIANLASMVCPKGRSMEIDQDDCRFNVVAFDRSLAVKRRQVLRVLLGAAGLFNGEQFDLAALLDKGNLGAFTKKVRSYAGELEALFKVTVRRDLEANGIQQLTEILKLVGLSINPDSVVEVAGKKVRRYRLDKDEFEISMGFAEWRNVPWNKKQAVKIQQELDESADQWAHEHVHSFEQWAMEREAAAVDLAQRLQTPA